MEATPIIENQRAQSEENSGYLTFSVDNNLLLELGERLVSKPSIALAELAKNAYDADATRVRITLENVHEPDGTIRVQDNGHGMTLDEIRDTWMRVATPKKRDSLSSRKFGRLITGSKGVGRFAARRLGSKLTLDSVAIATSGKKQAVHVEFNWKKDFQLGQDLGHTRVEYTLQAVPPKTPTGVSLLIEGFRDALTKEDIAELRQDLLTLQTPFLDLVLLAQKDRRQPHPKDQGFDIHLEIRGSGELDSQSGGLGRTFLQAAWAQLDANVDEYGKAHYEVRVRPTKERDRMIDSRNMYANLSGARLRIYLMIYTKGLLEDAGLGVREAQRKGREEGGVRIYLDNFRVFPYGSEGDDWLRLNELAARNVPVEPYINPSETLSDLARSTPGRRPYLLIPKNNQVFGVVALSQKEHSGLEINIGRERLLETPTMASLRYFILNGIYWMTLKYATYVAEQQAERKRKASKTITQILGEAKKALSDLDNVPSEVRATISAYLDEATDAASVQEVEQISQLSMLRVLASAGTTISLMNHQLRAINTWVLQIRAQLSQLRPDIPSPTAGKFNAIIDEVTEWHRYMELQVSSLAFLLSPDSREQRGRHPVRKLVDAVSGPMSYYLTINGIKFINDVAATLRTPPIYQSEIYAVLINILSNAIKAVAAQPTREIAVEAERKDRVLSIRMKDTGVGLKKQEWERVFQPFVTHSQPDPVLGVGTGLGLMVVRDLLEPYGGTARFTDVDSPWKTCIEIVLPEREI